MAREMNRMTETSFNSVVLLIQLEEGKSKKESTWWDDEERRKYRLGFVALSTRSGPTNCSRHAGHHNCTFRARQQPDPG